MRVFVVLLVLLGAVAYAGLSEKDQWVKDALEKNALGEAAKFDLAGRAKAGSVFNVEFNSTTNFCSLVQGVPKSLCKNVISAVVAQIVGAQANTTTTTSGCIPNAEIVFQNVSGLNATVKAQFLDTFSPAQDGCNDLLAPRLGGTVLDAFVAAVSPDITANGFFAYDFFDETFKFTSIPTEPIVDPFALTSSAPQTEGEDAEEIDLAALLGGLLGGMLCLVCCVLCILSPCILVIVVLFVLVVVVIIAIPIVVIVVCVVVIVGVILLGGGALVIGLIVLVVGFVLKKTVWAKKIEAAKAAQAELDALEGANFDDDDDL